MIPNMAAADELAMIRAEIRRLELREAELRAGFLAGKLPCVGLYARVEVRPQKRRVFRKEPLPDAVLADPALWQESTIRAVTVVTPAPARSAWGKADDGQARWR